MNQIAAVNGWDRVLAALAFIVIGYGLSYFLLLQLLSRRLPRRPAARPGEVHVVFLIACLNEEPVIGATVHNLCGLDPTADIYVVDDGSEDATGARALAAGGGRVRLVTRRPPNARAGKGAALNEGLAAVRRDMRRAGRAPDSVVIAVMDADGTLSPGVSGAVAAAFADPLVGAVQLPVRIRNRDRFLTRLQDQGFWGTAVLAQFGRAASGSVSLGGNGQFTRLAALDQLGERPWSDSLTEDLDLTISLHLAGWRTSTTRDAWVEQEAPQGVRALLRQRTRWAQGHMVCAGRTGELMGSRNVTAAAFLELTGYLFQPWALTIPWSLLALPLLADGARLLLEIVADAGWIVGLACLASLYLLTLGPLLYGAAVYRRRAGDIGRLAAFALQHAGIVLALIVTVATWRALVRIALRRHGWAKTVHAGAGLAPDGVLGVPSGAGA